MSQGGSQCQCNNLWDNNMASNSTTSQSVSLPQVESIMTGPSADQISSMSMQQQMELSKQLSHQLIYLTQQLEEDLLNSQRATNSVSSLQLQGSLSENDNQSYDPSQVLNFDNSLSVSTGRQLQQKGNSFHSLRPARQLGLNEEERQLFQQSPVMGYLFNNLNNQI